MSSERTKATCEVCGERIFGRSHRVRIEGVALVVCGKCAELGEDISPPKRSSADFPTGARYKPLPPTPNASYTRPRTAISHKTKTDEEYAIVPGYGKIIQSIREKLKLDQQKFAKKIQVKLSRVQKWEAEKGEPTIQEARELEKSFQVKLLKKEDQEDESLTSEDLQKFRAARGASMGDFIKVRKK